MVQSGNDNTLSGVAHFDRDDEVYVIVTPNDGIEDGLPVTSSSITVLNTAPTAPTVSISPDPAVAGQDDLVCSVDTPSSDDDGDSVVYTYVWTDESGLVQQTTTAVSALSDTVLSSNVSVGSWTCEVTPSDGSSSGLSGSATAEVTNGCSSLYFDQSSNLEVMNSAGLALNEVSLSMWVQPYSTDYGVWVSKKGRGYGGHHAYNLLQDNGEFRIRFQIANCYPCNDSLHFIDLRGVVVPPLASCGDLQCVHRHR